MPWTLAERRYRAELLQQGLKICSKPTCWAKGKPQSLDAFYKHSGSKDGLHCDCIKCGSNGYSPHPRIPEILPPGMKRCRGECGQVKPVTAFGKDKNEADGLRRVCKECRKPYSKEYHTKHKEEENAKNRAYAEAHKDERHAKSAAEWQHYVEEREAAGNPVKHHHKRTTIIYHGNPYPADWPKIRKVIYERDGWHCQECGIHCTTKGSTKIQCHHINYDTMDCRDENLITLCVKCHNRTNNDREYWVQHLSPKITTSTTLSCTWTISWGV